MGGEVLPRWGRLGGAWTQECGGEGLAPSVGNEQPDWAGGCVGKVSPGRRVSFAHEGPSGAQCGGNDSRGEASMETHPGDRNRWSIKLHGALGLKMSPRQMCCEYLLSRAVI